VSKGKAAPEPEVLAAGGVIWRRGEDGVEVLLVHRPKYEDWTFAKGKLEPGERFRDAARREVLEETGYEVEIGDELEPTTYIDAKGRLKLVRYWTMTICGGAFEHNDEVDEVRWMSGADAAHWLSYARDLPLLASFDRWVRATDPT
jgi:8-oxo-dGTP pyrophosphatase MutT (NUDIX family)